jgi:hypothetical protein
MSGVIAVFREYRSNPRDGFDKTVTRQMRIAVWKSLDPVKDELEPSGRVKKSRKPPRPQKP